MIELCIIFNKIYLNIHKYNIFYCVYIKIDSQNQILKKLLIPAFQNML